ncbi:hypothetical protein BWZ22_07190 [Seonamhaeicola sp. S2-3]|uniref:HTH domain-containing protein n=1 Tax=Seonamhaeicola sp. S2-3 TaxID=1936081 RepID=UPI0009726E99|nr:HTH domain-containing protein [Seonamhaeicola sp. S2-3]APY11038.1 hypothetical protein BWZ22_07190 [Seonamhaeicola sp. S2-3]
MKNIKHLERLQQLHLRIEQENTGTPKELARFMNISERLLYNLIEELKDIGAPIHYNRSLKTYYYNDDFKLQIKISVTALRNNEILQLFGGTYLLRPNNLIKELCS